MFQKKQRVELQERKYFGGGRESGCTSHYRWRSSNVKGSFSFHYPLLVLDKVLQKANPFPYHVSAICSLKRDDVGVGWRPDAPFNSLNSLRPVAHFNKYYLFFQLKYK